MDHPGCVGYLTSSLLNSQQVQTFYRYAISNIDAEMQRNVYLGSRKPSLPEEEFNDSNAQSLQFTLIKANTPWVGTDDTNGIPLSFYGTHTRYWAYN
jgi:hypothetical protein